MSVRTMDVVDDMAIWEDDGNLLVFGDRDKFEMAMVSMSASMFSRANDLGISEWRKWALVRITDLSGFGKFALCRSV